MNRRIRLTMAGSAVIIVVIIIAGIVSALLPQSLCSLWAQETTPLAIPDGDTLSVIAPEETSADNTTADNTTVDNSPAQNTNAQNREPTGESAIRYVLTRQGVIREGIVQEQEKAWYIRFPDGKGGITISKLDTVYVASTRLELFDWRKNQIRPNDTAEILKLADWALRNQLAEPGIAMLNQAIQTNRDYSAREALEKKRQEMEFVERIKGEALARRNRPDAINAEPDPKEEEQQALETWSASIPISVQEKFIRKVQPVLMRRCVASDCHNEDGENPEQLVFYRSLKNSSRRVNNLRNMKAVLARVDLEHLNNSPILTHPAVTDVRGQKVWPFGNDSQSLADYELFRNWILAIPPARNKLWGTPSGTQTSQAQQSESPMAPSPADSENSPVASENSENEDENIPGDSFSILLPNQPESGGNISKENAPSEQENVPESDPNKPYQPKDIYDPELFNRQTPTR